MGLPCQAPEIQMSWGTLSLHNWKDSNEQDLAPESLTVLLDVTRISTLMTHLDFSSAFQLVLKGVMELWTSCQLNLFFSVIETGNNRLHRLGHSWPLSGRSWSLHGWPGEGLSLGPQSLLPLTRSHSAVPGESRSWYLVHCWVALDLFKRLPPCLPKRFLRQHFPLARVLLKARSKQRRWGGPGGSGCGGEGSVVMPRVSTARRGSSTAAAPGPGLMGGT